MLPRFAVRPCPRYGSYHHLSSGLIALGRWACSMSWPMRCTADSSDASLQSLVPDAGLGATGAASAGWLFDSASFPLPFLAKVVTESRRGAFLRDWKIFEGCVCVRKYLHDSTN